ncbi:GNAT family N-acetyltransferase [Flagellimonas sp. DF-77]|uniref:GNAT family N-acetyltransferase n=1 Tax=Flagellimonas algarum TaxID=3230298 RepID=UPI00339137AE
MPLLNGTYCFLRALEPADLDFLYQLENDTAIWELSGTVTPYSKGVLREYLKHAHRDIYEVKQLRLGICTKESGLIGLIDLFDFDPRNKRVGLGIVVLEEAQRNQGVGGEAIGLVTDYAFAVLDMNQVYANILEDNQRSLHLFAKMGFTHGGTKKEWVRSGSGFKDELLYQKFRNG